MIKNYYSENTEELFAYFSTNRDGLSSKEAAKRLEKYGQNVLPKKKKASIIKIFLSEFCDPLVLMLLVAIIASIIAGEIVDAIVILGIILVDAIGIGIKQDCRFVFVKFFPIIYFWFNSVCNFSHCFNTFNRVFTHCAFSWKHKCTCSIIDSICNVWCFCSCW